jgi:hypothetical protein
MAARHPEAKRLELWFADAARIGQMGRVTHVWHAKGERPRGRLQQERASVHVFGAICPERDTGVALALPAVSTAAMSLGSFAPKSWPSSVAPCRPTPMPRWCSTAPAGTSATIWWCRRT